MHITYNNCSLATEILVTSLIVLETSTSGLGDLLFPMDVVVEIIVRDIAMIDYLSFRSCKQI